MSPEEGNRDLEGKVALITGGTSHVAKAIAKAFDRRGVKTVLSVRDLDDPRLKFYEGLTHFQKFIEMDLEDDNVVALPAMAYGFNSRLDYIVNNAAVKTEERFVDSNLYGFDQVLATNLRAPYLITKGAIRVIEGGHIVNLSSDIIRDLKRDSDFDYSISKAALNQLVRHCYENRDDFGFTTSGIELSYTLSGMSGLQGNPEKLEAVKKISRVDQVNFPFDVANLVMAIIDGTVEETGGPLYGLKGRKIHHVPYYPFL